MQTIDISQVLLPEMTILDRETFSDKDELFQFMASRFAGCGIVTDAGKFQEALAAREAEGSTYIGSYLALPHGICEEVVRPGVGFCRVKTPFLYRSHGEEGEVKYIFTMAIAGDQGKTQHLKILAALSRLLAHDEFLERLGEVESHEEIIDAIREMEEEADICL